MGRKSMELSQIGKKYYARFSCRGNQYRFSLRTNNKKVANQIVCQLEHGLDHGIFESLDPGSDGERILKAIIAQPGLRPEEALDEAQTIRRKNLGEAVTEHLANCKAEHSPKNYVNELRVFNKFVAHIKIEFVRQVTPQIIEQWRNKRVEFVSKTTVNRELKMIKRFFKRAVLSSYISKSPAENLQTYREPENVIRHLSDDEVRRVLEPAPEDLRKIITVLLLTGLRYGELCYLEWPDLDFRHRQIIIQPKENWRPKNFKKRIIPMHPIVEKIFQGLSRKESISYVFPDWDGVCCYGGLRNRLYRVFSLAKVDCNVKDMRSTFASNAAMSGIPIYTVSKLLGHHDVKITEKHYAHLAPDYMGNAITMLQPKWELEATKLIAGYKI